jgi:hypothetical protein
VVAVAADVPHLLAERRTYAQFSPDPLERSGAVRHRLQVQADARQPVADHVLAGQFADASVDRERSRAGRRPNAPGPDGPIARRPPGHAHRPAASAHVHPVPSDRLRRRDRTRRVYGSYWNRIEEHWATGISTKRHLRTQLVEHVNANVVPRRNARGGRSAGEHLVAALRCLYGHAEDDGLIDPADNPASKVAKPRQPPSRGSRHPARRDQQHRSHHRQRPRTRQFLLHLPMEPAAG